MRDFCDAQLIKESEVFKKDPKALQLIMYYDEIEIANPLGAKAGIHKLGAIPHSYTCTCIHSYRCLLLQFGEHSSNFQIKSSSYSVGLHSQECRHKKLWL